MKRYILYLILLVAMLGVTDSGYLTWEHYANVVPPCSTNVFVDCGAVLKSEYSVIYGTPLAVLGLFYYSATIALAFYTILTDKRIGKYLLIIATSTGLVVSIYLMYIQLFVIGSICLYCTGSALISAILFFLVHRVFHIERKRLVVKKIWYLYRLIIKPILFLINPETVHNLITDLGEVMGKVGLIRAISSWLLNYKEPRLSQKIKGISFENPIGLAAGFDYEARLTQLLPSLGFGFSTAGTITNMPYEGNPTPRLGRLPKSKSLMVNKGFKSTGAEAVSKRLSGMKFDFPFGVSIGRTNSEKLKNQKDSVDDIVSAFKTFEKAKLDNAYYELNISCPNLIHGDISFYPPKNLEALLTAVDKLKINKPIFVKMPIEKGNKEISAMLQVIVRHNIQGVIFGNLQKDRKNSKLDKEEVKKFKVGYFSGKPTYERSNELISLAYKKYKSKLVIIGCGGVFNGRDAFEKISRGASLVQLLTGMVYEGPQLAQQINFELIDILEKKGYKDLSEAIGSSS